MKKLMMQAFIFATIFALGAFIANVAMYVLVTLEILELGIDIVTVLFIGILAAPIGLVFGFWPLALEEAESPLYRKYRIKKMNMAFQVIQIPYYCFLLYRASPLMHGGLLESMILMSVITLCASVAAYLWYKKYVLIPIQLSAGTDQDGGKHNPTWSVAIFFIVFAFMFGAISEKGLIYLIIGTIFLIAGFAATLFEMEWCMKGNDSKSLTCRANNEKIEKIVKEKTLSSNTTSDVFTRVLTVLQRFPVVISVSFFFAISAQLMVASSTRGFPYIGGVLVLVVSAVVFGLCVLWYTRFNKQIHEVWLIMGILACGSAGGILLSLTFLFGIESGLITFGTIAAAVSVIISGLLLLGLFVQVMKMNHTSAAKT